MISQTENYGRVMKDKIYLVTGATSGIGKVTARSLAELGAQVVLVARNPQKAQDTVDEIRTVSGNEDVNYLLADFSDLDQIRRMANVFYSEHDRLDVLVNNAGAYFSRRTVTRYGVENTFLVNHLAPFLLTKLLMGALQNSPSARIVNVASGAHRSGKIDFNDLTYRRFYFGFWAYSRSKLANILFTYELARRLTDSRVTANALDPGRVKTDIWNGGLAFLGPLLKPVLEASTISPEDGADNSIFLASSPEVEGVTGKYFIKRQAVRSSDLSYNESLASKLWEVSEQLCA